MPRIDNHAPSTKGLESLYELPVPIKPLDSVRGTILALDWRAFHELGFYDAYVAALPRLQRDVLLASTAGSWVPVELLRVHYQALDSLAIDDERVRRTGWSVGSGAHGAFLLTLIRLGGALGVSPWVALKQSYKLWVRSWHGGAIAVHTVAPRVARVTLLETGVCASRFFRMSFSGALCAGIAPFCSAPEALEIAGSGSPHSVAYRVAWT